MSKSCIPKIGKFECWKYAVKKGQAIILKYKKTKIVIKILSIRCLTVFVCANKYIFRASNKALFPIWQIDFKTLTIYQLIFPEFIFHLKNLLTIVFTTVVVVVEEV